MPTPNSTKYEPLCHNRGSINWCPDSCLPDSESRSMIPYWIELNPEDLIQGTAVVVLAIYFLLFTLTSSARA
jgi:hypothetical protein